jgi:hypothetical protein
MKKKMYKRDRGKSGNRHRSALGRIKNNGEDCHKMAHPWLKHKWMTTKENCLTW